MIQVRRSKTSILCKNSVGDGKVTKIESFLWAHEDGSKGVCIKMLWLSDTEEREATTMRKFKGKYLLQTDIALRNETLSEILLILYS